MASCCATIHAHQERNVFFSSRFFFVHFAFPMFPPLLTAVPCFVICVLSLLVSRFSAHHVQGGICLCVVFVHSFCLGFFFLVLCFLIRFLVYLFVHCFSCLFPFLFQYRDISVTGAVGQMYSEMAGRWVYLQEHRHSATLLFLAYPLLLFDFSHFPSCYLFCFLARGVSSGYTQVQRHQERSEQGAYIVNRSSGIGAQEVKEMRRFKGDLGNVELKGESSQMCEGRRPISFLSSIVLFFPFCPFPRHRARKSSIQIVHIAIINKPQRPNVLQFIVCPFTCLHHFFLEPVLLPFLCLVVFRTRKSSSLSSTEWSVLLRTSSAPHSKLLAPRPILANHSGFQ